MFGDRAQETIKVVIPAIVQLSKGVRAFVQIRREQGRTVVPQGRRIRSIDMVFVIGKTGNFLRHNISPGAHGVTEQTLPTRGRRMAASRPAN